MRIGAIPPLAAAFQNRTRVRETIDTARAGRGGVVLTQVLAGGGGYGKSQLAAAYANDAINSGTELVVWVHAAEEQALITTYARAATAVHAPGAGGDDPVADAEQFMAWLATTSRSWLVVLDNITDPAAVQKWWPQGRAGWVLATTRLHTDARLTAAGRTLVPVDVYTPQEAHTYLKDRLTAAGRARLHHHGAAGQIIEQLGRLPLALGFAAAYMIEEDATCGEYLDHLTNGLLSDALPAWADAEDYGQPVTAALLLNLQAATATGPPGLVEPALRLAALLDPDGHPLGLWDTPPVLAYLTAAHHTAWWKRRRRKKITAREAHAALAALHRYGLLTRDRTNGPRAVRIHALTARAVRETTPAHQQPALATTAADALLALWPDPDQPHRDLATTLRANTDTLHTHTQPTSGTLKDTWSSTAPASASSTPD
ncbi:hypothetical protein GCM10009716_00100 [Streptomyces sodiiphilus]|uniref:NB-ARC domain-containing protein n=1 Tax=Streptomyces sodiiphilus TaxID=226217 RepID=A0ABN2NU81_9ACTN